MIFTLLWVIENDVAQERNQIFHIRHSTSRLTQVKVREFPRELDGLRVERVEVVEVRLGVVLVGQPHGDVLLQPVVVHVQHELGHNLRLREWN